MPSGAETRDCENNMQSEFSQLHNHMKPTCDDLMRMLMIQSLDGVQKELITAQQLLQSLPDPDLASFAWTLENVETELQQMRTIVSIIYVSLITSLGSCVTGL